ncbi:TerD family protein [Yinghuangia seranimata]|uniref:TerD family protein n=1 Tax=Yinghuangia seranimata TaxID=408067 RepID=UPI00248AA67A|nr:TerD family protein [Yinghuangia seranimata]MDI2132586.1 TerD family protein [Yinghuangia seranimata]
MPVQLAKGGNHPLGAASVVVEVAASVPVDVSAILVDARGGVRSDADFVFYNQPTGPGVRHQAGAAGTPAAVYVDTAGVPADIAKVVVALSLDGTGAATFGAAGALGTVVRDAASGVELVAFTPTGLARETALLLLEIYRRGTEWKVRAIGQGYANGLAGIATDFGVQVDEPAPPAPVAQPVYVPPPPVPQPTPQAWQPPAVPQQTAVPTPPPPPPPAPGGVNLDKGRVTLAKNQSVSLVKTGAPPLTRVRMALGWDPAKRGMSIDLDASCIAFDGYGGKVATVWFGQLHGLDRAIVHSGDNLTGEGDGDDEVITVHLDRIPPQVTALVFTVNSFLGQKFNRIARAYCRLVDDGTQAELVRYELTDGEPRTAVLMCMLTREGATWRMTALGEFTNGRTVRKLVNPARDAVQRLTRPY